MSAVIKPSRLKKLPVSTPALWIVLGLAATFFLVRYGQEVLLEHDINAQVTEQQRVNAALTEANARLDADLQYMLSDKYVEQRAREDLNLRRPDEEVLIPVEAGVATSASAPLATTPGRQASAAGDSVPRTQPNWERWMGLFAPFDGAP